jgi:hypothetical protein
MKKLLVLLILTTLSTAHSAILFEPMFGTTLQGEAGAPMAKQDSTGTYFGARLGVAFPSGFILAGEYQSGSVTRAETPDVDYDTTEVNAIIGYDFGMMTFWIAQGLQGDYVTAAGTGYEEGGGIKYGLGFQLTRFINLNFEWKQLEYDETTAGAVSNFEKEELLATISFPFYL